MFAELLPVLAIAGVAIAIVYLLFNQLSSVPTKKSEAARVLQAVESQAKAAKTSNSPSSAKNMSKKEKAEAKKREEELDALVAKEALAPARGLAAEKYNVETLDDAKAKNKAKKEASKKSAGQAVAAAETKGPSEEQKAKDRAQGFKIVEEKKESSPVSAVAGATGTSRRAAGTKKASPTSPAAQERAEIEKKLSSFFGNGNRRRRNDDDYSPAADKPKGDKPKFGANAGVTIKKEISAARGNAWENGDKEWA